MEPIIYDENENQVVTKIEQTSTEFLKISQYSPSVSMQSIVLGEEESKRLLSDLSSLFKTSHS